MIGFHKPEGGFPLEPDPISSDYETHIQYVKWWHKLLLPFCKPYKSVDGNCFVVIKRLFGKMFVVDSGYLLPKGLTLKDKEAEDGR